MLKVMGHWEAVSCSLKKIFPKRKNCFGLIQYAFREQSGETDSLLCLEEHLILIANSLQIVEIPEQYTLDL